MIQWISSVLCRKIKVSEASGDVDAIIMRHGMEKVVSNVLFLLLLLLLSLVLQVTAEMILVVLAFNLLRRYAHGAHANSLMQCSVFSMTVFVLVLPLIAYVHVSNWTIGLIGIGYLILVARYAPSDTEKTPIFGEKARKTLRYKALLAGGILVLIAMCVGEQWVKVGIMYGMTLEVITLLPVTYRLLKQRRNNYEGYK